MEGKKSGCHECEVEPNDNTDLDISKNCILKCRQTAGEQVNRGMRKQKAAQITSAELRRTGQRQGEKLHEAEDGVAAK